MRAHWRTPIALYPLYLIGQREPIPRHSFIGATDMPIGGPRCAAIGGTCSLSIIVGAL
jgi:hypothetical protein